MLHFFSTYRYRWTVPITYITNRIDKPTLIWFNKDVNRGTNTGYYNLHYKRCFIFFSFPIPLILNYISN